MKKHTSHHHHLHAARAILCGVLLIAVAAIRLDARQLPQLTRNTDGPNVLAYSTSMSRAALLAENNASRAANGKAGFTLNTQLNNSAQAKAQNMADNNYWAHVAPDGTQPWFFFEAAGYSYSAAGENLAYGFESSNAVNQGWMNSPTHKANILGDYTEVGFGFVNAPSYQGGEYTIVVAHYGKPLAYTPPPVVSQPTPAPTPVAAAATPTPQAPTTNNTPQPAATPSPIASPSTPTATPTPSDTPASPATPTTPKATPETPPAAPVPVAVGTATNVSVLDTLRAGHATPIVIASLVITLFAGLGYVFTHRALMRQAVVATEHFALAHPAFDAIIMVLALSLILSTTIARLQ